ncbi:OmpA family protein [Pararhodobacter sp.]|uniref:OmpA family protein n=1 Tax=Pararhodobacter sp. TaxID=2127056 RepID=UPI002AFF64E7|nr:OmpA family protein [Pararhodobacter sp.]
MSRKTLLVSIAAFVAAAVLALGTALLLVALLERRTAEALQQAFARAHIGWVQVTLDGLNVTLAGTAPDESARINALQVAGEVVDATRISETIAVTQRNAIVAPVFRVEMMRNRDDLSVIGLVPARPGRAPIAERLRDALPDLAIEDLLQTTDYAVPGGWVAATDFAVAALEKFEVGRISVTAGRIEVEALVDGPEQRRSLEEELRGMAPRGQVLTLDLIAPRPVAAPFLLRVDAEAGVLHVGACNADTEEAQQTIATALTRAGYTRRLVCPLALGAPTPRWGEGAALGIAALASLGEGNLTMSDGTVILAIPHTVSGSDFDRAVGTLETALPEAFSLSARHLDPPPEVEPDADAAPEVQLRLTEEGRLSLAGRLPDERIRAAVGAFAGARFGRDAVEIGARLDPELPSGWAIRVLTVIEALAELHHGEALVRADRVRISGVSGNPDARSQVTQALLQGLGSEARIDVQVRYDEALDPVANAPTPDNCEARIHDILRETKITFDPGSTEINADSAPVIDRIAEVLRECGELPFEVAGYTDSQGREETNLNLSQARAEAVINALLTRRVLVASLVAQGHGAADPIADNRTEAGREANRRIEFRLIRPEAPPEPIDPALEAELTFEVQSPDADTIRPRPRPGSQVADAPTIGSGDEEATDETPAESQ